jgi:3-phenylpropionate/trans-cinnamate dioxygenase ferredoxin reductase subunit
VARRYVIVGSGEAGTRAALALRDLGADHIVLIGAEPDIPYERPPLSKPDGDEVRIRAIAQDLEKIDSRFGIAATGLDRQEQRLQLSDGAELGYDRLLLATGARPRPFPTSGDATTLVLRTRADAEAIFSQAVPGKSAIILGAGLIGLELAAELRRRNVSVTILELGSRAMARVLPSDLAQAIVERHLEEGVDILFNAKVAGADMSGVTLEDGRRLLADLVIASIGVVPNTELAEAAGLACKNGIVVDSSFRTADPMIFAAGDCAAIDHPHYGPFRFETWRNACDQGSLVARAMMGEEVCFSTHPWFWTDQYELGLQMVGLHNPQRHSVRRDLSTGGKILFELDADGVLRAASGLGPKQNVAKDIRLAEMLIDRQARPNPKDLSDPTVNLKSLLRSL